jgi:hypothetical protein
MIRPPKRSVSAPTGIRPSEPTTTGTATSRACWNALRCRPSFKRGPSGLSSVHAQKLTANPTVAGVSMRAPMITAVVRSPRKNEIAAITAARRTAAVARDSPPAPLFRTQQDLPDGHRASRVDR